MRFFSLFVATGAAGLALAAPYHKHQKGQGKICYIGINEAGPEFGEGNIPGVLGQDYIWPDAASMQPAIDLGMTMFRINILMERLIPDLRGQADGAYLRDLTNTVNFLTGKGIQTLISAHNYGRFKSQVITDVEGFKMWWTTAATPFKDNKLVWFDTNNEYKDMDQELVVGLNQAAIDGIREAGAVEQSITVEGNDWTGAWKWVQEGGNSDTMGGFVDPAHPGDPSRIIYQMHQYSDTDSSGTSDQCVSGTIMAERLTAATDWLRTNGKKGIIGEFAGGSNPTCYDAIRGGLQYMEQNSDVWIAALWWAKGKWWKNSKFYDFEAPDGIAWKSYGPLLKEFI
ncbi:glycoside hydrolase superfamily [Phyllosticta citrichinensis]|uniref:cellulase n=1 Tax=Phyllosticta citrichinensis TaxID=1130410 RepID=A0ABR1Y4L1_9PEZI